MTSDRRVLRAWALALVLALLATALVALRPTGATLAAWSDEVTVEIPAMATGGIGMDVAAASGGSAHIAVSGDAAATWRPSAVRATLDGQVLTGAQLHGSRVDYRVAGSSGQCATSGAATFTAQPSGSATSFPVTGGERLSGPQTLCLTFVPSDRARIELSGRSLGFTTELDGVAPAATWSAAASWAATHRMPAGPSVADPTCAAGFLNQYVTIGFDWDRAGLSQDVSRWSLQVRDGNGSWQEAQSLSRQARSVRISPYDSGFVTFASLSVRVAAVLPDGTQLAGNPINIRIERIGLGAVYCR